jgi:hypothetical protein
MINYFSSDLFRLELLYQYNKRLETNNIILENKNKQLQNLEDIYKKLYIKLENELNIVIENNINNFNKINKQNINDYNEITEKYFELINKYKDLKEDYYKLNLEVEKNKKNDNSNSNSILYNLKFFNWM